MNLRSNKRALISLPAASRTYLEHSLENLQLVHWDSPYLHHNGTDSPEGRHILYQQCIKDLEKLIADVAKQTGMPPFIIGKNLGGGLAPLFCQNIISKLAGMIVAGAIPDLSEFWATSTHVNAIKARLNPVWQPAEIRKYLQIYDLKNNIALLKKLPHLIQVGTKDPWIEPAAQVYYQEIAKQGYSISFYDDDHDLQGEEATKDRAGWLRSKA